MGNFVNRVTCALVESGNTPEYPVEDWLHNPDLSLVISVPRKYWKVVGDAVVEMDQSEKDGVDTALEAARIERLTTGNVKKEGFAKGREYFELTLETNKWLTYRHSVLFGFEFAASPQVTISNEAFDNTANLVIVKVDELGFDYVVEARGNRGRSELVSVSFDWEAVL